MGDVIVREGQPVELEIQDVVNQAGKIQKLMSSLMKKDEHYGVIPGIASKKPSLFKAGAEKLCFTFRFIPEFEITRKDLPDGHREYEVKCTLRHQVTQDFMGQGVGLCSTMESKYRYRKVKDFEVSDLPIPADYKGRKDFYKSKGYGCKQIDGVWKWVRYREGEKQENPDIADCYNTVLKMAKKRAHVDATITACAASDIFTQDLEDLQKEHSEPEKEQKKTRPAGKSVKSVDMEKAVEFAIENSSFSDEEKKSFLEQYKEKGKISPQAKKKFGEHILEICAKRNDEAAEVDQTVEDIPVDDPEINAAFDEAETAEELDIF